MVQNSALRTRRPSSRDLLRRLLTPSPPLRNHARSTPADRRPGTGLAPAWHRPGTGLAPAWHRTRIPAVGRGAASPGGRELNFPPGAATNRMDAADHRDCPCHRDHHARPPRARRHPGVPDRSGQGGGDPPLARLPHRPGAPAHRGRTGGGQDHPGPRTRPVAGAVLPPGPVHQRPPAGRRAGGVGVRPADRALRVPPRPHLRPAGPRRRGQPGNPEGAERAPRGHGGTPGHAGGHHPPAAGAVLRHRHPEPLSPGRHLPAARVATGPLPHVPAARLPRPCRRA